MQSFLTFEFNVARIALISQMVDFQGVTFHLTNVCGRNVFIKIEEKQAHGQMMLLNINIYQLE